MQWPALHAYFDRLAEEEQNNDRVQRVASNLSSLQTKLICRFVLYALQALNKFQSHWHHERRLFRAYLANFIKPELIVAADDITELDYKDRGNQLSNDSLAVGTETLLFLSEMEDDIVTMEKKFFVNVRLFYETVVSKMLANHRFDHTAEVLLGRWGY